MSDEQEEEYFALECIYGSDITNCIKLSFTLPKEYPSVKGGPLITVVSLGNMSPTYRSTLLALLQEKVDEGAGSPILFHVINSAQEWLDGYVAREKSFEPPSEDKDEPGELLSDSTDSEDEERPTFNTFTPLTPALFKEWNEKYRQHVKALAPQLPLKKPVATKLTGRQLFELDEALAIADITCAELDGAEGFIDLSGFDLQNHEHGLENHQDAIN